MRKTESRARAGSQGHFRIDPVGDVGALVPSRRAEWMVQSRKDALGLGRDGNNLDREAAWAGKGRQRIESTAVVVNNKDDR